MNPGVFTMEPLPNHCQTAPINDIVVSDLNQDKLPDLVMAGNLYQSEIETGRADAGTGYILLNQGKKQLDFIPVYQSGFYCDGDVKSLKLIHRGPNKIPSLIAGKNKAKCQLFDLSKIN